MRAVYNRFERDEFSCFRTIDVSIATTLVRIRGPRAPSESSSSRRRSMSVYAMGAVDAERFLFT